MTRRSRMFRQLQRQFIGDNILWALILFLAMSWLAGVSEERAIQVIAWLGASEDHARIVLLIICAVVVGFFVFLARRAGDMADTAVSVDTTTRTGIRGVVATLSKCDDSRLPMDEIRGWLQRDLAPDVVLRELRDKKHPWVMPIHALRDLEDLKCAVFVVSPEALEQWAVFHALLTHCLPPGSAVDVRMHTQLEHAPGLKPIDVTKDFEGLVNAFTRCTEHLAKQRMRSGSIAIDITSGTKLCSAAAALVALDGERRMFYSTGGDQKSLSIFEVRYDATHDAG